MPVDPPVSLSPFPDDDSLGLPEWCPRAPACLPPQDGAMEAFWTMLVSAARSPTLTDAGRRFMAEGLLERPGRGNVLVPYIPLFTAAARSVPPLPAPRGLPVRPKRSSARGLTDGRPRGSDTTLVGIDGLLARLTRERHTVLPRRSEVLLALEHDIATGNEFGASDSLVAYLSRARPRSDRASNILSLLVGASFACRLEWTRRPPADWWWPVLTKVCQSIWPDEALPALPAAFLPPDVVDALVRKPSTQWRTLRSLMLTPAMTPEQLMVIIAHPAAPHGDPKSTSYDDGQVMADLLRYRRDLPTLAPHLLPVLLGHPLPALAAVGLEVATHGRQLEARGV